MTDSSASTGLTHRAKVSTGYGRLDEALQGGFFVGSAIVLNAPAGDEAPLLIGQFLKATHEKGLLISRTLTSAQTIISDGGENVKSLVCSDKPISPSRNFLPGKGIENLTDVNLQISETVGSNQPKRVVLDILSDILLRHKALQTRKWLTELLERLRSKDITTLVVINPLMHSGEDVQAVIDLFDGNLEIVEQELDGQPSKFLRIKWIHGIDIIEKELPIARLAPVPQAPARTTTRVATAREPRWLAPLISRNAELSKLKAAFENALVNKPIVIALQGESGVGKTRLMQELAVYAQSKGAEVLTGTATEEGLAYAPWIEVARQYVAQTPGELLRRMLGTYASEFARLVPDIPVKIGTIPPSKALGEAQEDKIRLYEAITQFFISICDETPLLLLFDDMQYADQPSLELLEYFVRSTSSLRVLTVCSLPPENTIETETPLEQTFMKFNKQRLLETVPLKNLNEQETMELIKQIFGEEKLSADFVNLIYSRTGGNPFFVEEVLRALVEDGIIFRTEKGWDRKPVQELAIPKSVKTALRTRLAKLNPEAVSVLTMASVIGSEFDFAVLREVIQAQEDALLEKLEAAIGAGLILEVPTRKDVFRFADSRIRELLLGDLIQSRRIRYHVKIAEAMEKVHSNRLQDHAEGIASHFSDGGDTERATKYSIMAGDGNLAIHAYEQAIRDYKRALDLLEIEGANDVDKASTLRKLAESCQYAGQSQNAVKTYKEAISIYEKQGDLKACARISVDLASAVNLSGGSEVEGTRAAIAILQNGLNFVKSDPESFEAAAIFARLATSYGVLEEWKDAEAWAQKGLEVGEKSNNRGAIADALSMKASFLTDTGRIDEGLPLWEKVFEVSSQNEQYFQMFYSLLNIAIYTYPRDLVRAREFMQRRLELSKKINYIGYEAGCRGWLGYLDWLKGDWASALEETERSFQIWDRSGTNIPVYYKAKNAELLLSMGSPFELVEACLQASDLPGSTVSSAVNFNLALGKLRLEQGRRQEAKACFESGVNSFKNVEFSTFPLLNVETLLHLTSLYVDDREYEKARDASQWALRLAEPLKSSACMGLAMQAKAGYLVASKDEKGAEEAYKQAMGLWEKAGWPYYHAKTLVEYANATVKSSPEESRRCLQDAVEIFKKLGAKRGLEKAEAALHKL